MDLKTLKLSKFEKALISLEKVMQKDLSDSFFQDSAIQRFEYTIEIFWKTIKVLLDADFDLSTKSPRETIKTACNTGLITDEESIIILKMLRIRNETSHDYAIEIAKDLAPTLPDFTKLLRIIFDRIKKS